MKAIIFSDWFEPSQELLGFCDSLGMNSKLIDWNDNDIRFNPDIIDFCEQRLSRLWNENVYKGKESCKFRVGFAGAGYIRDIDINKCWRLSTNNVDAPIVKYVSVETDKYGQVKILNRG